MTKKKGPLRMPCYRSDGRYIKSRAEAFWELLLITIEVHYKLDRRDSFLWLERKVQEMCFAKHDEWAEAENKFDKESARIDALTLIGVWHKLFLSRGIMPHSSNEDMLKYVEGPNPMEKFKVGGWSSREWKARPFHSHQDVLSTELGVVKDKRRRVWGKTVSFSHDDETPYWMREEIYRRELNRRIRESTTPS